MNSPHRFSTNVELRLLVGEREFPLSHVGPGYVIFREAVDLPPGEAMLSIMVDGDDRQRCVRLPHGVQPFDMQARIVAGSSSK